MHTYIRNIHNNKTVYIIKFAEIPYQYMVCAVHIHTVATALCTIAIFFGRQFFGSSDIDIEALAWKDAIYDGIGKQRHRGDNDCYAYTQSNKYYGWARIWAWQERRVKHNEEKEEEEVETARHSSRHFSPSVNIAAQSLCIHIFTCETTDTIFSRYSTYTKKNNNRIEQILIAESQSKRFMYLYSTHTASVCIVWETERVRQKGIAWNSATFTWASWIEPIE